MRSIIQDRGPCRFCDGVQSLKDALKSGGNEASKVQASVILGEYFVIKGEFTQVGGTSKP
nr:hypothetical protein [uncultured Campylobacter sp.]